MQTLTRVPLLVFAVVIANVLIFAGAELTQVLAEVPMPSGGVWSLTTGDLLLSGALILLFFEVLKSTRTSAASIADHMFSLVVAVGCLVEFIVVPKAACSAFFLITMMTFVDVVAGFSVTITSARRDLGAAVMP